MDLNILINVIGIFILIILSSIFSSSETGIIASSRAKIHILEKEGNIYAKKVSFLQKNIGQMISSLLIGGTLINILATTLATGLLVRIFGETGIVYSTIIMGALIIFYGEVMPKIIAINYPEKTALMFSPILKFIFIFFKPLTLFLNMLAKGSLKIIGIDLDKKIINSSVEEIRGLIEMQAGPSDEIKQERSMLRGVLDLSTVDVDEVMTHRKEVFSFNIDDGAEKLIEEIFSIPFTRIPLWKNKPDNIVGVLHAKEFFKSLQENKGDLSNVNLYEIISKPWFIPETTALLSQLQMFRKRREHFSIVVDEYGCFIGVITLEDILEEIVGEIVDEHDIEIPGVRVASDGSIVVIGTVTIRDLNRQFNWNLSDNDSVTIAGFLIHEVREIPNVGKTYKINNLTIKVLRKNKNQISLLRIYKNN